MRWLLLDEVEVIRKKILARTRSHVPAAEVSCELLFLEMMAQTGALLLGAEGDYREDLVFAKVEEASFSGDFKPGDPIHIEATCENLRPEGAWLDARIRAPQGEIARSRFLLMKVARLGDSGSEPVTFHREFMSHFKISEKVRE